MRWVVIILLMLLSVSLVNAKNLYQNYVYSGDTIKVDNVSYKILGQGSTNTYELNYSSIIIQSNSTMISVRQGKCVEQNFYEYCFESNKINLDNPRSYNSSNHLEPEIRVVINSKYPEITITRPSTIKYDYGQKQLITVTIKNTGESSATVEYLENIPYGVIAEADTNSYNDLVDIKSKLVIQENSEKTLTYFITPLGTQNYTWKANYSYTYGQITKTGSTSELKASMNKPYTITQYVSSKNINNISENPDYVIEIKNNHPTKQLLAQITLKTPLDLITDLQKNNNEYTSNFKIMPNKELEIRSTLNPEYTGEYLVESNVSLKMDDLLFNHNYKDNISIKVSEAKTTISTSKNKLLVNEPLYLELWIENRDSKNTLQKLNGRIIISNETDTLDSYHLVIPQIIPKQKIIPYNKTIIQNGSGIITIAFEGSYSLENTELRIIKEEKFILIGNATLPKINTTIITIPNSTLIQNNTNNMSINGTLNQTNNQSLKNTTINNSTKTIPQIVNGTVVKPNNTQKINNTSNVSITTPSQNIDSGFKNVPQESKNFFSQISYEFSDFFKKLFGQK